MVKKILMNIDSSGYHNYTLAGILDSRKDSTALTKDKAFITTKIGNRKLLQTTMGCQFHVKWKDGTKKWIPMNVLKFQTPPM